MTDTAAPPPAPRPRRWLRWVLVASLALNLLLVGLAAGGAIRAWQGAGAAPPDELFLMWRALPEGDRRALRGALAEGERPDRAERRAQRAADLAGLRAVLTAEPFDPAALAARLAEARDRQTQRMDRAMARMVDRVAAMSPAGRAELADRLERRARRWHDDD